MHRRPRLVLEEVRSKRVDEVSAAAAAKGEVDQAERLAPGRPAEGVELARVAAARVDAHERVVRAWRARARATGLGLGLGLHYQTISLITYLIINTYLITLLLT